MIWYELRSYGIIPFHTQVNCLRCVDPILSHHMPNTAGYDFISCYFISSYFCADGIRDLVPFSSRATAQRYGLIPYHMVSYHIIPCRMILYCQLSERMRSEQCSSPTKWYGMVWHQTISFHGLVLDCDEPRQRARQVRQGMTPSSIIWYDVISSHIILYSGFWLWRATPTQPPMFWIQRG